MFVVEYGIHRVTLFTFSVALALILQKFYVFEAEESACFIRWKYFNFIQDNADMLVFNEGTTFNAPIFKIFVDIVEYP